MEPEANVPLKSTVVHKIDHLEESDMLVNDEKGAEVDYSEEDEQSDLLVNEEKFAEADLSDEDEDYLPKPKRKQRFTGSASKRSLPIFVYTYKVKHINFISISFISLCFHSYNNLRPC